MSVTPRAYGNANAMALLMAAFTEGDRRNRALGYWGAVGSAGPIVGQLLGGVNVPIGIVTIAAPCSFHIAQRVRRPAGHSRLPYGARVRLSAPMPRTTSALRRRERCTMPRRRTPMCRAPMCGPRT
jgi:MFS family permease